MSNHIENLKHNIYPEALKYLTDKTDEKTRHIDKETLETFKVGLGKEKFFDDENQEWRDIDVVYFPMYRPIISKNDMS